MACSRYRSVILGIVSLLALLPLIMGLIVIPDGTEPSSDAPANEIVVHYNNGASMSLVFPPERPVDGSQGVLPADLWRSSSTLGGIRISSVEVRRLEGGNEIQMFTTREARRPAATLSSAADNRQTALFKSLEQSSVVGNVSLTVASPLSEGVVRIAIDRPFGQFMILGGGSPLEHQLR